MTCFECMHYKLNPGITVASANGINFANHGKIICGKFNMFIPEQVFNEAEKQCRDFEFDIPF